MRQRSKELSSVLIKPAGPDCNMACRYCFYLEKEALFPSVAPRRMTDRILTETVRQVMRQGGSHVSFGWQGGEPTLMGVQFFRRVRELQKTYGRSGQVVGNGLQTNGLLIDDEWCRVLAETPFLVGLSLDGPQHVHDHYRVGRGGAPTWQRVMETRSRLLDHGVEVNALTVVSDYSAHYPREIYQFHKENGLTFMQFIPCVEPGPEGEVAPFSVTPEQYGEFLCQTFDCWMEDFRAGEPTTYIRWFESLFYTYVGLEPPECTLLEECGNYVVIEHNGDVFSCDFFVEDQWRLGNVLEGELSAMLNSGRQTAFGRMKSQVPMECRECRWLPHCRGGCTKERLHNPHGKTSYLCEAYKGFFAHADVRMRELATRWRHEQGHQSVTT
jgi:uncharacterized protein